MPQNVNSDLFHQWYKGKRHYRFLLCRKANPLSFQQRLCFSFVAFRTTYSGTTPAEIHRATKLDQYRTVPNLLGQLQEMGLVQLSGKRWVGLPPPPAWYVQRKREGEWHRTLQSFLICYTPQTWTPARNALYFMMLTGNVQNGRRLLPHQRKAGLAAMLGISDDTVLRGMADLEEIGLLKLNYLQQPTAEHLGLFPDRSRNREKYWLASMASGVPFGEIKNGPDMAIIMDSYTKRLLKAGYTKEEIAQYWAFAWNEFRRNAPKFQHFLWHFDTTFQEAEKETYRNRLSGKFNGRNSLGMLHRSTSASAYELNNIPNSEMW